MEITRQLRIRGRVQGVGFRDALRREAIRQGCSGWVRNRLDGSVEAVVQGSEAAVRAVVDWSHKGPPASKVTSVEAIDAQSEHDRPYEQFDFLKTA
jgi:acylphosphatase